MAEGDAYTKDEIGFVIVSGNVFRDLGHLDADREQVRAVLAAKILAVLDERRLTVRTAQDATGVVASDFSRIRRANLGRFTIDRRMSILARLGQDIDITVAIHPRREPAALAADANV